MTRESERVSIPRGVRQRRLHKAILRYHDPKNWAQIREALTDMGMKKLIGKGPQCLVPAESFGESGRSAPRAASGKQGLIKHTSPRAKKMRNRR